MIDAAPYSLEGLRGGFNRHQWFMLPLSLRQHWWSDTDYGRNMPSEELKAAIRNVLGQEPRKED